ncbi:polysaccharide deacetylase family protein [Halobacillus yeomjeoni]|uniref:polysaccharide deacetylase family protein n=1 Tax=Halobacillus yeomjeoni TaxID=311194 RepID=UPI001CD5062B|nr:polysaccharide deacetylase family protein [Halobacillus yeomjeoni]MCA0983279.1 polysaccharide deacetylase family protein [Halobacillus yeomjeoni]
MRLRVVALWSVLIFICLGFGLAFMETQQQLSPVSKTTDLYEVIESRKAQYEWKPENARIDSVWKKTPGIEGREVDVDASYKKMKKKGKFDPKLLVYKSIKPERSMEDLDPSPIYRGNPKKEMVAFLVNVSWGEEYLPGMLKTLADKQVKANFFIDGAFAEKFTDHVQMIEEQGHLIGSHGYKHKDMGRMSKEQAKLNLEQADDLLFALTKTKIEYFAPPAGSYNQGTVEAAHDMGMETILWTVDTVDWKKPTTDVLIERVMGKLHNGATILMHPTQVTEKSLPALIDAIRQEGYRIGTLPTLLSEER